MTQKSRPADIVRCGLTVRLDLFVGFIGKMKNTEKQLTFLLIIKISTTTNHRLETSSGAKGSDLDLRLLNTIIITVNSIQSV